MRVESVTTPFGRRPMSLGMLTSQCKADNIASNQTVDKWKIFRALCEAKPLIGISDRALAVLNALLSFYPGNLLSKENGLVIFPSNAQLSIRAHGMAPATLRRHLAALVDVGLLVRKDSPNGKRYARRDSAGEIGHAFGFSIAPLIAREKEISLLAAQVSASREQFRIAKEQLSLCRRDVAKLIETTRREGLLEVSLTLDDQFRGQISQRPRAASIHHLLPILRNLKELRRLLVNTLENHANAEKSISNESHSERHIEESHPESISELEMDGEKYELTLGNPDFQRSNSPRNAKDNVRMTASIAARAQTVCPPAHEIGASRSNTSPNSTPTFSLEMVLRACPEIVAYAPGGSIRSWRDLVNAALVVRRMLGVSADAFERACVAMGREIAASVMACVLQKAPHIASAGGYLRDLTRRTEHGAFSVGPMLMALLKIQAGGNAANVLL